MSLGLVSYDDSDESDNDVDSNTDSESKVIDNKVKTTSTSVIPNNPAEKDKPFAEVFHVSSDEEEPVAIATKIETKNLHLPESKISLLNTDIDIRCLTSANRKNGPVKILIPSLNQVRSSLLLN